MVKKIFTKMVLASTLFLGGVLGVSIANRVATQENGSIENRNINVKRSGESAYEQLSSIVTFDQSTDANKKPLTKYVKNGETDVVTIEFSETGGFSTNNTTGNVELTITRNQFGSGREVIFTSKEDMKLMKLFLKQVAK
jgi:hypothetical protein